MRKIIIIGGGAAGMIAAVFASKNKENEVFLIEKNEKLGKKLYITGKGRCNLTNDVLCEDFLKNVVKNPKFLYKSIYNFTPQDAMSFFEEGGLALKVERGNRVFPASDKASDVTKTLSKLLNLNRVKIKLNETVKNVETENGAVTGVVTDKGFYPADSVIVCTGGVSYPLTGSTGDGYKFAKRFNIGVVPPKPALVGIETENVCQNLQGLSLKNVTFNVKRGEKVIFSEFGEMLFTHFGVSGPIILSCSSVINTENFLNLSAFIDLKPALSNEVLSARLTREFENYSKKELSTAMATLLPKSMVSNVLSVAGVSKSKKCMLISEIEKARLVNTLKNYPIKLKKLRPIDEAIVTSGGIDVKELDPKTMQSKKIKGLFFAGEVIDVDAFTGGFNIQIAMSTGKLAGENA